MLKIPIAVWIANAAACLTGSYGDVTHQAEAADCSRQTVYDHAHKVRAAVQAEHADGPTHAALIQENERLRQENARLWDWLAQTIEFPAGKQHEFTVTATAMGLSLNQVLVLLALVLGAQARPGRSTIQRWIKAAGQRAARVLKHLDRQCQALVLVGCLDEIFFRRRPVLVGVEPASMVWFLGRKADDRQGATWCQELQGWTALQSVLADAGTGLQAGIALVQQQRCQQGQVALENGLDVFHTAQEARRVLRLSWNRVERLWEQAEAATRQVAQAQQQGRDARGVAATARAAWTRAEAAFARFEESEAGWRIAHAALQVFRPDGPLNDRSWATEQVALALPKLSGREWSKVRGFLQTEETFTFLDRMHRQLREAQPDEQWRGAVGAVVVAAAATPSRIILGVAGGFGSCGASGANGGLPQDGCELAGVVPAGVSRAPSDGACQQCGRVYEQRAADAPGTSPHGVSGVAGPEAAVLELSGVS